MDSKDRSTISSSFTIFIICGELKHFYLQSQFLSSGSHEDRLWIVPITLSMGSYNRHKAFLLETKFRKLDVSELVHSSDENLSSFKENNKEKSDEHLWVKVNTDQIGFYRVKYEDKLAAQLRRAVESNYLSAIDRFGVSHVQKWTNNLSYRVQSGGLTRFWKRTWPT